MAQSDWWSGDYQVTQPYGATGYAAEPAGHGHPHWHAGIDFGVPAGNTIHAAVDGVVSAIPVQSSGGYGNLVRFRPSDPALSKWDVLLAHNARFLVANGAVVKAGTALAITDSTGNSSGAHVHFEVRPAGGAYGSDVEPSFMLHPAPGQSVSSGDPSVLGLSVPGVAELQAAISGAGQAITDVGHTLEGEAEVAAGGFLLFVALSLALVGLLWEELPVRQLVEALPGGAALVGVAGAIRRGSGFSRRPVRATSRAVLRRLPTSPQAAPRGRRGPEPLAGRPRPPARPQAAPETATAAEPVVDEERAGRERVRGALRSLGFSAADADRGVAYAYRPGTAGDDQERVALALRYLGQLRGGPSAQRARA